MNQREKEAYLREYALLKSKGKPFFPYAVAKDSIMALIVMLVIIFLALMFGAELEPKANPTTTAPTVGFGYARPCAPPARASARSRKPPTAMILGPAWHLQPGDEEPGRSVNVRQCLQELRPPRMPKPRPLLGKRLVHL